jgi:hypothetical protein
MAIRERGGCRVTCPRRIPNFRLGRGHPGAVGGHRDQPVSAECHNYCARPAVAQLRRSLSHAVQVAGPQQRTADGRLQLREVGLDYRRARGHTEPQRLGLGV